VAQLTRSETDKKIAGVAGGMAAYVGADTTLVRVLWIIAMLMGWGFIAYVVLWIVLPKGPGSTRAIRLAEMRYARGEITVEAHLRPSWGSLTRLELSTERGHGQAGGHGHHTVTRTPASDDSSVHPSAKTPPPSVPTYTVAPDADTVTVLTSRTSSPVPSGSQLDPPSTVWYTPNRSTTA
jgi:phage shock protein C